MSKQDVGRALHAMDEESVRERLAGGDFAAVDGLDLTADEQAMVREAADDYPEVAGFAWTEGKTGWICKWEGPEVEAVGKGPFGQAAVYAGTLTWHEDF
jgi:hypothetical protein